MKYPFYTGLAENRRSEPAELPNARQLRFAEAAQYFPDPGLVDAVNVALLLRQPLLLTGRPGTGKTQLAYSVAWELGFDEPLKFETKSTATASDLFYTYDSLKRFQHAQEQRTGQTALDYITYNALGTAILRACDEGKVKEYLPPTFEHGGSRRSVVLIDEVDKAPRDFPNDILGEIENMYFRVPELGNHVIQAPKEMVPIVIITSNSERDLPDAFLRRCVYYHIPFPEREALKRIVDAKVDLKNEQGSAFLNDALDVFELLRSNRVGLRKLPATAELIGWMRSLRSMSEDANPLAQRELALRSLSSLIKTEDDIDKAKTALRDWVSSQPKTSGQGDAIEQAQ